MGPEVDQYVSRIGWAPGGNLFFYRGNRLQNHFEVILAEDGATKVLYEERDEKYVEMPGEKTVTFLDDGRFIVHSERDGYAHLYLHDAQGAVANALTSGPWEVKSLLGVSRGRAYYLSNEGSPLRNNLWSVGLDGRGKQRLTQGEGIFSIAPSHGFKYFISYFSNASTPNLVRLHKASGEVVRTLEDNAALRRTIAGLDLPQREFFSFETTSGVDLNGWMLRPRDFDTSGKYPVLMFQYSGPGSQEVLDIWEVDWYDALVQKGYVVACVDGRGTGGRGAEFRKCTYGNLGGLEATDQIEAAKYLAAQPWADHERIGIYGWSFGGFTAHTQRPRSIQRGHCRRTRDIVAVLRLGIHRNIQRPATGQPTRLRRQLAAQLRSATARQATDSPRHRRRQRPHPKHIPHGTCTHSRR